MPTREDEVEGLARWVRRQWDDGGFDGIVQALLDSGALDSISTMQDVEDHNATIARLKGGKV